MKSVANAEQEAALARLEAAVDDVFRVGLTSKDHLDANRLITRIERVGNRIDAAKTELMSEIDEHMLYANDGHFSARVMVRHKAKISGAEYPDRRSHCVTATKGRTSSPRSGGASIRTAGPAGPFRRR